MASIGEETDEKKLYLIGAIHMELNTMMDFICLQRKRPLTDGISGATPHGSFDIKLSPAIALKTFVVKIEINHSTDFNEAFPKSAKEGEANYSGGKEGSGQPAIV